MLTLEALNSSKDLVAVLADKGVSLRPKAGSPIEEALAATHIWGSAISCLSEIDGLPAQIYNGNETQIVNGEVQEHVHDCYMESASSALGTALAGHVAFATTVVIPAVHELHNKLKEVLDIDERTGVRSYTIEMVTGSPLFDVPAIVNKLEEFASIKPQDNQVLVLDYPELTDEQLLGLLKIGAEAYDTAVDQFVANEGIELIREVWNVVFAHQATTFKTYDEFRVDRVKGTARNFATFLFADRLLAGGEGVPTGTGVNGLSSSKYTYALKNLVEVTGSALYIAMEYNNQQMKHGKLIEKVDNKTVFVNKSVYDRYMEEGGDVETVLGAAISGDRKTYLEDIVAGTEKYKQAWAYQVTLAKQNTESGMLISVRRAIGEYIRHYVRTTDDEVIRANVNRILDNAEEFISRVYNPELKDIDILAMKAVCLTMFNHTDAICILRGVNEAMAANSDISTEDALNLAVVDYVADWFADQIEIA
ncbi:hypothetical protein [Burkholderia phage FLC8]|nr:hypothetical protein [Burkholderia phage FLC8]